ncbi:MAG: DUF3027 domain-containing protein [Micromonosporaceae bacterium]
MGDNRRVTSTKTATTLRRAKLDAVCAEAVDLARDAMLEVADDPATVGDYVGAVPEDERLVTHLFDCLLAGYRGWRWAVTVTRVPRSKQVTVCEIALLPGPESVLSPEWVPWQERLQPGDLGVGDLMPTPGDDDRLAPGYVLSDDPGVEETAWELGLGRVRVMSRFGRIEAAERWYESDQGPEAPIAKAAPKEARCGTCGFYLPLAGSMRAMFGACGNLFAPDDGQVVSADHGCGAHSEVLADQADEIAPAVIELPTVYDDAEVESVPTES